MKYLGMTGLILAGSAMTNAIKMNSRFWLALSIIDGVTGVYFIHIGYS